MIGKVKKRQEYGGWMGNTWLAGLTRSLPV
jgi:hypothetical protein